MIKANKGNVTLEGNIITLSVELSCVIYALNNICAKKLGAEFAEDYLRKVLELGFEKEAVIKRRALDKMANEQKRELIDLIRSVFDGSDE